jgi:DNA replication protein DnaD
MPLLEKLVGWSMDDQHHAEVVKAALRMALDQRRPAAGQVASLGSRK